MTANAPVVIRSRAPLRLSFAGGGTDVPPFPEREGGLVLSATINRYARGTLIPRDDGTIMIQSLDLGVAARYSVGEPVEPGDELELVKGALHRLQEHTGAGTGFDLTLETSAPPGSGLGASSALMVALVGAMKTQQMLPLSDYEIAQTAHTIERHDLGLKGGMQDHYASVFGGFNFIEFQGDQVLVNPLRVRPDVINELEQNLLLCFTGATRASDHIIEDQQSRYVAGDEETQAGLREQKALAVEMKDALLRGRLADFGALLGAAWEQKKRLSSRITTPFIEEAYERSLALGALGGKVTGAGGGGFMLLYCRPGRRHLVAEELTRLGGDVREFGFEQEGLTTWSYRHG